jgi:hypothetical protein
MTRRELLGRAACGFGSVALAGVLGESAVAAPGDPLAPRAPMFPARAKRVIFLFMQGGPSHVDTFDYKPELVRRDGQSIDFTGVRFGDFGKITQQRLMKPLWGFRRHGQCGRWVSDLFPNVARFVDDLCVIHSMQTEGVAHGPATLFMHTGATNFVRPSFGSWISYGLGTLNRNLPAFVTICPSSGNGGPRNYGSAFLPPITQGTPIGRAGQPSAQATIKNLAGRAGRGQFDFVRSLNRAQADGDERLEAVIQSYELAYRMQASAPGVMDVSDESPATLKLYGIGEPATDDFGRQCLLARRLVEAGVRTVQVNYADDSTNPRWDQHAEMKKHEVHARATDKPTAGLLADLKSRGLLEDTLVWWGGEFGRTPFAQGKDGRDHNPRGFTVWLSGGGVKAGVAVGATDEIGHYAVAGNVHMHDLHATILHLMGVDHEKLTYRYAGRDFRLTDVYGRVVTDLIA